MTEARKSNILTMFNAVFGIVAVTYLIHSQQWHWLWWTLGVYLTLSVFGNAVGFHRYVSHRSFVTYTPVRWFLLFCGTLMCLGSPVTWAMVHRTHHMYPDKPGDPHSPKTMGFFRAWFSIGMDTSKCSPRSIRDLTRDPDMLFFHRQYFKIIYSWVALLLVIDWRLFLFAYALPIALLRILFGFANAWIHTSGYRNYDTDDASVNSLLVSWLLGGEGFHNNHHARPNDWNNWDRWWEVDIPTVVIRLIKKPRY